MAEEFLWNRRTVTIYGPGAVTVLILWMLIYLEIPFFARVVLG